ncbi:MAG: ATPase domain-containing protein [Candidatus Solibacter sp.]
METAEMVRTGIAGLDEILMGGIPRKNVILVEGTTGSGKTLLGVEFIYRGITEFNEPGIIVLFEISPDKLIRDAATLGWDLESLQQQKKLQIVFTSPQVLDQEVHSPDSLLLETAADMGAHRIFIDGIGLLRPAANAGGPVTSAGVGSYRETLQQLIEGLDREHLTTMLSHELLGNPESLATSEGAVSLADTVIRLSRTLKQRRIQRSLEIVKSRGQDYVHGEHTLEIHDGKGLEVFRRVQVPLRNQDQITSTIRRSLIGSQEMDGMIGGGVFDGSTTIVVGPSGLGKTILGLQILMEGAMQQKRRGLLISLDEHTPQIVRNAESVGIKLKQQIESGGIHVLFQSPQEINIDAHFSSIVKTIEENDIGRMVIDGMTSYSTALGDQSMYRDFFHALVAFSKNRLMTTFFNYENPEFLGISSFMPEYPVTSIVDNIILMNLVEISSTLRRCLTVVKARGTKHEYDSREYVIGDGGITLLPAQGEIAEALPLSRYASILSRAPSRLPAARPPAGT